MKTKGFWLTISFLVLLSMILMSCATSSTTSSTTKTSTSASTTKTSITTTSATTTTKTTGTTTGGVTTTTASTSTAPTGANWWDKFGTPQYGETLVYSYSFVDVICDPAYDPRPTQFGAYMEWLWGHNMTTDRAEYPFSSGWVPLQYMSPWMAESWEQKDPLTITMKLRQDIKWHNRAPTNGRGFTADDAVFAFDRALGTGSGFTEKNPFFSPGLKLVEKVTALDKYTLQFKLNNAHPMAIYAILEPALQFGWTAPEWWALTKEQKDDFHNVVGTGAFMLTDFVPGTSITFDKNPDYWRYDERYPENKLPYLDHWKVLAIPDMATQLAALRTGKVDMIVDGRSHVSYDQAMSLQKTDSDIQLIWWEGGAGGATFRYGSEHFSDIRVRKAMQMAVDTQSIIDGYFRGAGSNEPGSLAPATMGPDWAYPYANWPKELQDEYKYNIDAARNLMSEAGYPNGFATNILFSTQDDINMVQILKDQWTKLGIIVEIDARDPVTAGYMTRGGTYTQLVAGGGGGGGGAPQEAITSYWTGKSERAGQVSDPVYDDYVDKFFAATTMADCQKIFKDAAHYVATQHWGIQIGTVKTPQVFQPWIKGWNGENLSNIPQWSYYAHMWIDQSLKQK